MPRVRLVLTPIIVVLLTSVALAGLPLSPLDSIYVPTVSDTLRPIVMSASTTGSHSTKSPGIAMLASAILPGAGQLYNESYWKVPAVMGFGLYFASQYFHYNRLANDARDKYYGSIDDGTGGDQLQLRLREYYKDQRDSFAWYFVILYLVNIADAYVDASLYDFDVGDDLSLRLMPDTGNRIALQLRF